MPTYDTHPNLGHPEVAGWVLGSLDPPDAEAFGEHLACCSQCQGAEAEFEAVARAFRYPVPDAEPPPELEARVLAGVQHAVLTAQPDRTPAVARIQRPVLGDRRDEGTPEPPATPAKAPPARSLGPLGPLALALQCTPALTGHSGGSGDRRRNLLWNAAVLLCRPGDSDSPSCPARFHRLGSGHSSSHRCRLVGQPHRGAPQGSSPRSVLRVLVCGAGKPPGPSELDHGWHFRRWPEWRRDLHHVERRGSGQVQDHADHGRAARRRRAARPGHPQWLTQAA